MFRFDTLENTRTMIRLHQFYPSVLLGLFSISLCTRMVAQDQSVTDTIAFIMKKYKKAPEQCDAMYELTKYYWNIASIENAEWVITKSKELAEENNYHKGIYDAYGVLGSISLRKGDQATALAFAQEGLKLATKNKSEYGTNKANYALAVMAHQQGNIDSIISLSERVLEGPHLVYDSIMLPRFNVLLGIAYLGKGDYHRAHLNYLEALRIAEKTNELQLQVVCYANLGLINHELKNYNEALKYQRKSLAFAIQTNQMREVASVYQQMASVYKFLNLPDSSIYYYKKALTLFQEVGIPADIADLKTNLGAYLVALNQPDSGMQYLIEARQAFAKLNDSINIAGNAMSTADAWWRMGHDPKNKTYLNNALREVMISKTIAELKKADEIKLKSYYYLAGIYDDLENESEAFYYLKKYTLINDTIRTKEYTQQIAEMQTKYESEKKEMEISKLNAENLLGIEKISRQRTANYSLMAMAALILVSGSVVFRNVQKKRVAEKHVAVLEKQNAIESMRTKIASDVHDEMGANLTRLGLNAQQLLQSPAMPEKEKLLAEKMSIQSRDIITGMREIIWASNPANDNLKSMLGFMRQYIDRFFDGTDIRPVVNFPHDVGEVTLHPEVRRNLFLILKESLNNAVKYSGSDRIEVDFLAENEKFRFTVKDYGKGLPHENKDAFTNGLHSMQKRAEQIQSLFRLISAPGQGVEISVEGKLY